MSTSEFSYASEHVKGIQSRSWVGVMALTCCVLLQRWVCVYTRLPICGALEWIWWGSMSQCPERIGFQYGGQLGKHMYPLVKGIVAFGFVCHMGTETYLL